MKLQKITAPCIARLSIPILFLLFLLITEISAEEVRRSTYFLNGGMFYHLGYAQVVSDQAIHSGLANGLGGRLSFYLGRSFRIGGMGFNTGFTYASLSGIKGSYVSVRAGGVTAEYVYEFSEKIRLSAGILAGGARLHHVDILSETGRSKLATYEKYGSVMGSPIIIVEYFFSTSAALALMHTWVAGNNFVSGNSYGPCFHAGVLFNR